MIPYEELMALPPRENIAHHTERDTIIYALGLGAAAEAPADATELTFVYEDILQALPTMPLIMAYPGFYLREPYYRVDWAKALLAEQCLTLHARVPVAAIIRSVLTFDEVFDKGPGKGALLLTTRRLYDVASGDLLATLGATIFMRGDGGCGGRKDRAPAPYAIPDRRPDIAIDTTTRIDQALIYRLSGDINPLHIDPAVAAEAGFNKPILHGLCTYGIVGRALLKSLCSNDPARFLQFNARFSSPVFPGETIRTEIWIDGSGYAAVRARVVERDIVVLNNGFISFDGSA